MVRLIDVLAVRILPAVLVLYVIFLAVWESLFHIPFGELAMWAETLESNA